MGAVIALISSAALAFQEQQSGTGGAPSAPQAGAAAPVEPDANMAPSEAAPAAAGGTEIRIPGLGKLGVLPKMDFGLELLYGANEGKAPAQAPRDPSEDLTIRGSLKHRF